MKGTRRTLTYVLVLLGLISAAANAEPQLSPQVKLVRSLYQRFAGMSVLEQPSSDGELVDQPRAVLLRYFDQELTSLWLQDRACVSHTREICRLDFSPIWDSQDPVGATVRIEPESAPNSIRAVITYGTATRRVVHYKLIPTRAGWRVHDIAFEGSRPTLLQILRGNLK